MSSLTPAEDVAMFTKTAEWIGTLDADDMVDLVMEIAVYNAQRVVDLGIACSTVLEGLKNMEEEESEQVA